MKTFLKTKLITARVALASTILLSVTAGVSYAAANTAQANQAVAKTVAFQQERVSQDDPYVMVKEAASKTFARIKSQQAQIKQDPEVLRTIMEEELMPYIDYSFSSYKVLGKYAREVAQNDRKGLLEFVSVFREYLITTYAVAMGYYDDQLVEFDPATDYGDRTDVTVRAVIKDDTSPDIKVAFKVRKDKRSGKWEAYDMIAEGISLLSSKQTEFESILRRDGIHKVIELMRESIRKPIVLKGSEPKTEETTTNEKA